MQMLRCCLQAAVGCTGLWGCELMMPAGIFCGMESQCDNLQTLHVLSIIQLSPSAPKDFLGSRAALDLPAPNFSLCRFTWDGAEFLCSSR